jgi:tetratricopeptide (TPR) repeat protein
MKKIVLLGMVFCLFLSYVSADNIEQTNDQFDNDIKVVGPLSPMAAPSANEQAMTFYNYGSLFLRENRLEEAERYLKAAIDLDPLFVDAMDHLGMVYRRQNRLIEAEEIYLRSIGINNENKVPYQNLAVVYRMQNRLNDAFELYRILIQLDENDPEGYYGIGELFFMVGNYQNSMLFFDRAIELYINVNSPYVFDAFYYKGMAYYGMNDYDNALKYLEEALRGNPDNTAIRNTINEIKRGVGRQ